MNCGGSIYGFEVDGFTSTTQHVEMLWTPKKMTLSFPSLGLGSYFSASSSGKAFLFLDLALPFALALDFGADLAFGLCLRGFFGAGSLGKSGLQSKDVLIQ